MYIWARREWPAFTWDAEAVLQPLAHARHVQGKFLGHMGALGFQLQEEAQLEAVTEEVVKSSEIEGEHLDRASVRSSVARQLGLPFAGLGPVLDRRAEGVVEMMLDATTRYAEPLTRARLFDWHGALFPSRRSGLHEIRVGAWRNDAGGPMQVVSGPVGRTRVHYEAPPAKRVPREMAKFLSWFNARDENDGLLRAALAHFWFVTVHPFEDGNGRVARAIAEMALAKTESSSRRFYSVSSQIRRERDGYYEALERSQKRTLDVTEWLVWFFGCYARAVDAAEGVSARVLRKAEFWRTHSHLALNVRQKKVLHVFLGEFEGKLTAKKWAALAKCSVDTAGRDIAELVSQGVLRRNPGGSKNTSYALVEREAAR